MHEVQCPSCGAAVASGSERMFCGQCGARVADAVADLEKYRTAPERFDRVAAAPGYQTALGHAPHLSAAHEIGWPAGRLVLGALLIAVFGAFAIDDGDPAVIATIAAVSLYGLVMAVRGLLVAIARVRATTERVIAIVAADEYIVTGRRRDPTGVCEHRLVLRLRDGSTRHAFAEADRMGDVATGDIGVAYLRRDRLVDYRWFDVMAPPLAPGEVPRAAGCTTCGAHQRFGPVSERCAYCATPLPRPDLGEFGARFRAAAASPSASTASARRVSGGVPSLLPPIGLIAAGAFFCWFAYQLRELIVLAIAWSPWFLLVLVPPLAPLVVGAGWLWLRSAPHRAGQSNELAVVVRKRSQRIRSKGDHEVWRHFVTVAAPSGARRELKVMPRVLARLEPGQLGVAHLRGDWLADLTVLE